MPMPPPIVADASGFLAVLTIDPEMAVVNFFNTAPPTKRTRERVATVFSDVLLRIVQASEGPPAPTEPHEQHMVAPAQIDPMRYTE